MLTSVLGAPGAGKSTIAPMLRGLLTAHVILDWDAWLPAASELASRDVRCHPDIWPGYRRLVRAVVDSVQPVPTVLLGPCTPDELPGWPIDAWVLLDCSDAARRARLGPTLGAAELERAARDAADYRTLGIPIVDSTDRTPAAVAAEVARVIPRRGRA